MTSQFGNTIVPAGVLTLLILLSQNLQDGSSIMADRIKGLEVLAQFHPH